MPAPEDRKPDGLGRPSTVPAVPAWATALARLMDDAFRIPGTNRRIGFDAILGFLLPGVGDALSAGSGVILILLAFSMGVPGVVLARMSLNVAIDAILGAIPVVGDWFDVQFKSNRKNVELIERFQRPGAKASTADYVWVVGSVIAVVLALLVPLLVVGWVVARAFEGRGL